MRGSRTHITSTWNARQMQFPHDQYDLIAVFRSPSLDCHLSMSSSTISACASSESHRSYDSFIGPYYNDDFYHRLSEVPPDSSLSRRILSESRLPTRPSRNSTYDGYLQQSKDNLGEIL